MNRGIKHSTHPGELLREEILLTNNLSVTEAAEILGVTRSTLSNIINEKSAISPLMALRISKVFGGTPALWLKMQASYDLRVAEKEYGNLKLKLKPYNFSMASS